jgi:hypothetical protein
MVRLPPLALIVPALMRLVVPPLPGAIAKALQDALLS